jgi:hypothetical protein
MFKKHNRTASKNNLLPSQALPQGVQPSRTVENPAMVQEHVRYDKVTEVQPVIHRQYDQVHVHHVEKHIMHEGAPNMGGVIERPPLVQDHINHRYITEVHPIHHGPSYQTEVSSHTTHSDLMPFQQQQQDFGPQQVGFAPQQTGFAPQQTSFAPQQTGFAPQYATQAGAYAPQSVPASAPGAGFGGAPEGKTARVKHHMFHRPVPTTADGRLV